MKDIDDIDFVDVLMDKAFTLKAPKMPDFLEEDKAQSADIIEIVPKKRHSHAVECTTDLEFLNAAGRDARNSKIEKDATDLFKK